MTINTDGTDHGPNTVDRRSVLTTAILGGAGIAAGAAGGAALAAPAGARPSGAQSFAAARGPSSSEVSHVVLEVDGVALATFDTIVSLGSEVEAVEFREGTETGGSDSRFLPGRLLPPKVTLKRVVASTNTEMAAWHEDVILNSDPSSVRRSAIVAVFGTDGAPLARYRLENAWPTKVEVNGSTDDKGTETLTETSTLACDLIQREGAR